ncbi:MAG: alpha-ketoglutarate-dependent dioxygenase AlkB [Gammaproteobacteria bacterium]|nr:alpha-ketoglutarate-dependent dioxygenase AlkB [Gammaproteobacteria bacterium]
MAGLINKPLPTLMPSQVKIARVMTTSSQQSDLFTNSASSRSIDLGDAELYEYQQAFSTEESKRYFSSLIENVNWQNASIRIAGRLIPIPRLQCWVADSGLSYSYSGITMQPQRWSEELLQIRSRVEALADQPFNAVLINLYRDGNDSVAWHADDEPELGCNPVVASVSFGASRPFDLKHRSNDSKRRLILSDGSVLVMGKTLQNNWLHQLPKVKTLQDPRINLTFRRIFSRAGT